MAMELYNIYIKINGEIQIKHALDQNNLQLIFHSIKKGESGVFIDGTTIQISNYESFKIFNTSKASNKASKGELKDEMKHYSVIRKLKGLPLLQFFGIDVTDRFEIPIPRSNKQQPIQQNELINPVSLISDSKRIFISHSSKDHELVKKFIDTILILGLGIKRENVFCTSVHGTKIRCGADFKKVILDELLNSKAVIQIITKSYKTSEVCLNEMGAAWVLSSNVIPLVGHPFNYDVGFINASSQQLKLNSKDDLVQFYDDYKSTLFTNAVNTSNYLTQITDFLAYQENFYKFEIGNEINFFYEKTNTIKGVLRKGIFGHPPAESFEEHTSYHKYYYLELSTPINILNGSKLVLEEGDFDVSHFNVTQIHVVNKNTETKIDLDYLEGKLVKATGIFFGGHTAWHQTEVMMSFSGIE